MAHPGRPRGRVNKKTLQAQAASQAEQLARVQQAQAQAQAQRAAAAQMGNNHQHQQQQMIKEEAGVQVHDEADLISFRNDALLRYITNHEYIENVMSKLIHTSKIIPPSLYPLIPKINDYENLKPEDVYFGDLEAMKYVEAKLVEQLNLMKQETDPGYVKYLFDNEKYQYQRANMIKLSELQNSLHDKDSVANLESELDNIMNEYKSKFNQEYSKKPTITQYSISIDKISSDIEVTSAPENYNPKLINSLINLNTNNAATTTTANNNNNNEGSIHVKDTENNTDSHTNTNGANFNNEELNGFQFDDNIDTAKFNGFSGIPMNQFDTNFGLSISESNNGSSNTDQNDDINNNSSVPPQDMNSNEAADNSASHSNTSNSSNSNNSNNSNSASASDSNNNEAEGENDDDNEDEDQSMEDIESAQDEIQKPEEQQQQQQQHPEQPEQPEQPEHLEHLEKPVPQDDSNHSDDHMSNNENSNNGLDMNDIFNENGDGDLHHLGMVDDDIGELYNFETGGDDDNGLMGGSEFELDFLNLIDHGME